MRHAVVRVSFRELLVQRDQWHTSWGPKKLIFLIREIDDATMTAAPVESCQSVARRSPWARLGSELDVGNRLRRMRERFHRWIPMRTGAQLPTCLHHNRPEVTIWIVALRPAKQYEQSSD